MGSPMGLVSPLVMVILTWSSLCRAPMDSIGSLWDSPLDYGLSLRMDYLHL